ncbi:unnamed protein product [Ranitomeya imitator]|uniref:C2H2-type domain-containing protein n=1 Tax=Ranitomeya imitator TaxID=111125 RepID=A0ABN9LGR1_9NEOB|nr:unnamed protein product [Ranitomeya imitator]
MLRDALLATLSFSSPHRFSIGFRKVPPKYDVSSTMLHGWYSVLEVVLILPRNAVDLTEENIPFSLNIPKNFICEHCYGAFRSSYHLKRHLYIHTGERPHECDMCDMKFIQKYHLDRHKRVHSGEKPYQCERCLQADVGSDVSSVGFLRYRYTKRFTNDHDQRYDLAVIVGNEWRKEETLKEEVQQAATNQTLDTVDVTYLRTLAPDISSAQAPDISSGQSHGSWHKLQKLQK